MLINELDAVDRRILVVLQEHARISNVDLAEQVGISPSPCWRRVKTLVSVFIQVTLERQIETALETFEQTVLARPEVMECYLMTGDSDYLLRVVVADLSAYERFLMDHLTRLNGVASIKSSFALKQVKYGTALPLSDSARA